MNIELIKFKNLPYYPTNGCKNKAGSFVEQITSLVDFIFNGDINVHPMGYLLSTDTNKDINRYKKPQPIEGSITISNAWENPNSEMPNNYENVDSLGPLERGFLNYISINSESVIILRGYRGTGKSELLRFLSKFMEDNKIHQKCANYSSCPHKNIKNIFLDFNQFSFLEFKKDLYIDLFESIGQKLKLLYNENLLCEFLQDCKTDINIPIYEDYKKKFGNIDEDLIDTLDWKSFNYEKKFGHIYNWLCKKKDTGDVASAFVSILGMLYFYIKKYPNKNCVTLFIDNIDKLEDIYQNEAIAIIDEINKKTGAQVVMTVRLTTFRNVIGNSSLSYCVFEQYGASPLEICLKRIKHYLDNKDTNNDYLNVRLSIKQKYPEYLDAFEKRLQYIYSKLTENTNKFIRLERTLEALPGVSIRKSIRLFRRLFYNYTIKWQETEPTEDMLIRSLYSYHYKDGKMDINDRRIHNLFCKSHTQKLTLSALRILHIMEHCERTGIQITRKNIDNAIRIFNDTDTDNLLHRLWKSGKRVIIYSFFSNKPEDKEKNEEATLEMTKSGYLYLKYLSSDLQYIQSCFEVIDTKFDIQNISAVVPYINQVDGNSHIKKILTETVENIQKNGTKSLFPDMVDYDERFERFRYIRSILNAIFYKDIIETITYKNQFNSQNSELKKIAKIDNMVTVPIIVGITNSIINIYNRINIDNHPYLKNELEDWNNFIVLVRELNSIFFPTSDYKVELSNISTKLSKIIE
ncbi:MAG: hypothetical protein LBN27_08245 [Prevotellaceae bacterium]|jgi:hypothetical protein|nr:hypothetical protein [Prevotellaceae bacterium]